MAHYFLNLAWNQHVFDLVYSGAYDKFLNANDKTSITFYGSIPGLSWNGGRIDYKISSVSKQDLIRHILYLNKRNAGFLFTFSNTQIGQEQLKDETCNQILRECYNPLNGVVIASDMLRGYIRNILPQYKIYSSSFLGYRHLAKLHEFYESYDIVVLPDDLNINFEFIKSLKYIDRTEIMLNSTCIYKCPYRNKHIQYIEDEIRRNREGLPSENWQLPCYKNLFKIKKRMNRQFIYPKDLILYLELGIKHFKFLERTMKPDLKLLTEYWDIFQHN